MPPRGKYHSDLINYHKRRKPDSPHSLRLPEDRIDRFVEIREGLCMSVADTLRFVIDAAEPGVERAIADRRERVVTDPAEVEPLQTNEPNPDNCSDDPDYSSEESGSELESDVDGDILAELGIELDDLTSPVTGDYIGIQDSQPSAVRKWTATRKAAEYAFFSKTSLLDFFGKFKILCFDPDCRQYVCPPEVNEFQHLWSLVLSCDQGHRVTFLSGALEPKRGIPEVTTRLYNAALCAGLSHVSLQSLTMETGLKVPSKWHFFQFQSGKSRTMGWIDAAMGMWEAEKSDLQQKLAETQEPAVFYVDARYDSSRSGFHGTVVFINQKTNLITEMVTLTRKEAGGSWHIETAAIAKGIQALREKGVNIAEIIHDDNTAVDSLLAQTGIESQKDLWHKSKNLMGKFRSKLQDLKMSVKDSSVESAESIAELNLYTVKQLRDWAKGKQLALGGNKSDLVKRIAELLFNLPSMTGPVPEGRASRGRPLAYPELAQNDVAYKLKSWIYTCCRTAAKRSFREWFLNLKAEVMSYWPAEAMCDPNILVPDIITAADHWAGLHDMCRILPGDRICCSPDWDNDSRRLYVPESVTHKAVWEFLEKRITYSKMKFYTKARENYHSETFHSVINKFAPKRMHWMKSHCARLAVAARDWNENIQRICSQGL
ncbi:hypothetical protein R1sor_009403 [Riccia sorocarpa]|uniref:SAP domain-containing protein n=1 Tax=Riccia sorocarpa TaxID=122646 RepID=A0ABD3HUZ9_9MARC